MGGPHLPDAMTVISVAFAQMAACKCHSNTSQCEIDNGNGNVSLCPDGWCVQAPLEHKFESQCEVDHGTVSLGSHAVDTC